MRLIKVGGTDLIFANDAVRVFDWLLKFECIRFLNLCLSRQTYKIEIAFEYGFRKFTAYAYDGYVHVFCYTCGRSSWVLSESQCPHVKELK